MGRRSDPQIRGRRGCRGAIHMCYAEVNVYESADGVDEAVWIYCACVAGEGWWNALITNEYKGRRRAARCLLQL